MTARTLIKRSLRFHWRSHMGVVLGAAVGSAALIGALIVGDSVRGSLRDVAIQRLGDIHFALDSGDRLFTVDLPQRIRLGGNAGGSSQLYFFWGPAGNLVAQGPRTISSATNHTVHLAALLHTTGTAASSDGSARANRVSVFGIGHRFLQLAPTSVFWTLSGEEAILNEALAAHLGVKVGDSILLRAQKPEAISAESPVATSDSGFALRLRVRAIAGANQLGNLSLRANQLPPYNVFVPLDLLQSHTDSQGRANWLLASKVEERVETFKLNWYQSLGHQLKLKWSWLQPKPGRLRTTLVTNVVPDAEALDGLQGALQRGLSVEDFQLRFRWLRAYSGVEIRSSRIFIEPTLSAVALSAPSRSGSPSSELMDVRKFGTFTPTASTSAPAITAPPVRILTYLVNQFRAGERTTPYSMMTATDSPLLPADLRDDEIVINQWLADDLQATLGAEIAVTYFLPDQAAQLVERTNRFRVRAILPMTHELCDRTLMPDFPGVAKAERAGDWDTSFPLVHKVRPKDDDYWRDYRGTPKAFVTLAAGQRMWANRFGDLTAVRFQWPEVADEREAFYRVRVAEKAIREAFMNAMGQPAFQPRGQILVQRSPASRDKINAATFGFQFLPVRLQALNAVSQSQDFGGLFIGFSFFLIIAALILMGLLFAFGLQQRAEEIGTLLALGFAPKRVRKLFLLEGVALAFIGGVMGVLAGIAYAKLMLHGLTTIWRSATNTSALTFHVSSATLAIGLCSAVLVAVFTIWLVLRKQARQPARVLLAGDWRDELHELPSGQSGTRVARPSSMRRLLARVLAARVIMHASVVIAVTIVAVAFARNETSNPGHFFGAGSLALVAGLAFTAWLLHRLVGRGVLTAPGEALDTKVDSQSTGGALRTARPTRSLTASSLSVRGAARRRNRSVATVALLACGVFLIVAIGAFRLDADQDAWKRSSGTGGFALIGESTLPIVKDLNTREGRDALGLDEKVLEGISFVPFRVREGDDASCLNLNRAQQPRLLGVDGMRLFSFEAFSFGAVDKKSVGRGCGTACMWVQLHERYNVPTNEVPAIGDAASIQWALHKKIGDTLNYQDERGNNFDVRLVGGLANSILQGSLIIDEAEFTRRFPDVSGYRMFLIDCPSNRVQEVSAELTRALQDYGFEATPAAQRLAAFNAVQNTYLNTFQILGGLGLLLGSAGLGIVVLRNVLERRGELALLVAVGFRRERVQKLVLGEHAALLCLGLLIGIVSALVAILPSLMSPRAELPMRSLALTLGGVLLFGLISTWLATRAAVRGNLLEGLRNE